MYVLGAAASNRQLPTGPVRFPYSSCPVPETRVPTGFPVWEHGPMSAATSPSE
ncbi:aspartate aminotransferase, partial [Streptomyces cavourensis]